MFKLSEEQIKRHLPGSEGAGIPPELPVSRTKQWTIVILDEGPPEPQLGHTKHAIGWSRYNFIDQVTASRISTSQLTGTKLHRLMDRYAGKEWLPTRLKHLDYPKYERADVLRGLRLYASASAENAAVFLKLYEGLPEDKRVLPPEALTRIQQRN